MAKPTGGSDLEPRVAALELQVAALDETVVMLEERIVVLEGTEPPVEIIEPPADVLCLSLAFSDGATEELRFYEDLTTDLGDYVGELVQQHCYAVTHGPWTVYFRPDFGGSRDEIVVEYGCRYGLGAKPAIPEGAPAHILEPYTATIRCGTQVLATIQVPKHYWAARWRWQSSPRPIVRTFADLVAMRALPPMSAQAMWGCTPTIPRIESQGPMTRGGLMVAMGATGDRLELGPLTEFQSAFLVADEPNGEVSMWTQAEASGTMGLHIRDGATGAPLDVQTHPYHGLTHGTITIPRPPAPPGDPDYFALDTAHFPALVFVPWLLTDDPYYLEEAQFAANYHCIMSPYHQTLNKLPGMVQSSQTRAWAWGVRDVARMAAFAPESPPAWLLPRSAFAANLNDCLTFAGNYLASATPSCAVFSCLTAGNIVSSWMMGFDCIITGWMKWSGLFPEWGEVASYVLRLTLELNAPPEAGGWDRRWPAPYQVNVLGLRETTETYASPANPDMQYKPSAYDEKTPTSWGECWELYQRWSNAQTHTKPLDSSTWTDDKVYQNGIDYPYGSNVAAVTADHYQGIQRAALALAQLAGEPGAAEAHAWLAGQMPMVVSTYGNSPDYRYAHWPE